MLARHVGKGGAAVGREAHQERAPVAVHAHAFDQALGHELVGDAGDVATGDHEPVRELFHLQAVGVAFELGHEVEARQGGVELLAQAGAHALLDQLRAGQQPQPQAQLVGVFAVGAGFEVER